MFTERTTKELEKLTRYILTEVDIGEHRFREAMYESCGRIDIPEDDISHLRSTLVFWMLLLTMDKVRKKHPDWEAKIDDIENVIIDRLYDAGIEWSLILEEDWEE